VFQRRLLPLLADLGAKATLQTSYLQDQRPFYCRSSVSRRSCFRLRWKTTVDMDSVAAAMPPMRGQGSSQSLPDFQPSKFQTFNLKLFQSFGTHRAQSSKSIQHKLWARIVDSVVSPPRTCNRAVKSRLRIRPRHKLRSFAV
jgi:hypothetical protein